MSRDEIMRLKAQHSVHELVWKYLEECESGLKDLKECYDQVEAMWMLERERADTLEMEMKLLKRILEEGGLLKNELGRAEISGRDKFS